MDGSVFARVPLYSLRFLLLLPAAFFLAACGGDSGGSEPSTGGPSISGPISSSGSGAPNAVITVSEAPHVVGQRIYFDIYASTGDIDSAQWRITSAPTGEASVPQAYAGVAEVYIQPQVAGMYTIEVTLQNQDGGKDVETATVTVDERPPEASLSFGSEGPFDLVGVPVVFDASGSAGPASSPLDYQWDIIDAPGSSAAEFDNPYAAQANLVPDLPGYYQVRLTVSANGMSDTAVAGFTASENDPPVLVISQLPALLGAGTVSFEIVKAEDPEWLPVDLAWELVEQPAGSDPQLTISDTTVELEADVLGEYLLRATLSDGYRETVRDYRVVPAAVFATLPEEVVDAEFDDLRGQMVLGSASHDSIVLLDAGDAGTQRVSLGGSPVAVSVSPDGSEVAVGGIEDISIVDLGSNTVTSVQSSSTFVHDVVHDGAGNVHVFPDDYGSTNIHTLEIATGTVRISSGYSIRSDTNARLQPGKQVMYGSYTTASPIDIERYDIDGAKAVHVYNSPYHGDYPMCGNLWFTEDGSKIITACGHLFSTSDVRELDMVHYDRLEENLNGDFDVPKIVNADHSATLEMIATVEEVRVGYYYDHTFNRTIRLYNSNNMDLIREMGVPHYDDGDGPREMQPLFVYFQPGSGDPLVVMDILGAGTAQTAIIRY